MDNKQILVKDILNICDGKLIIGNKDEVCNNFSKDTRTINIGDVYIGIKGENFDGNLFYLDAISKGAKICIIQDVDIDLEKVKKYNNVTIVKVHNTIKALQEIATYKRSLYNIPVVAITGSVGKTSTKDIIARVLGEKFNVLKTEGNLNNHIGLPLTILKLKEHEALVVEMGMNNLGEISVLTNIAKPNVAVITNVGTSHIGNLGSRDNILKAKLEILEGLAKDGILIINKDNDLLKKWYEENKENYRVKTYGIKEKSDFIAYDIMCKEDCSTYKIDINNNTYDIELRIVGEHFVLNSLCAISVASIFEIPMNKIISGILNFELTKNRMEIKKKNNITIINDCYNANYDSMKAVLDFLGTNKNNRKIAVLGDMLELGEFSVELHKKVGMEVSKNKIDILITVGKSSKNISSSAKDCGMDKNNIFEFSNNKEAINKIKAIMEENDIILVKASNGMKFKEIVDGILKD